MKNVKILHELTIFCTRHF